MSVRLSRVGLTDPVSAQLDVPPNRRVATRTRLPSLPLSRLGAPLDRLHPGTDTRSSLPPDRAAASCDNFLPAATPRFSTTRCEGRLPPRPSLSSKRS